MPAHRITNRLGLLPISAQHFVKLGAGFLFYSQEEAAFGNVMNDTRAISG